MAQKLNYHRIVNKLYSIVLQPANEISFFVKL